MKKIFTLISAFIFFMTAVPILAVAASLVEPNCLGKDISGFGQTLGSGFGGFISGIASGPGADSRPGAGGEFLAHLQGIPSISTCPDNGFPTPFSLP